MKKYHYILALVSAGYLLGCSPTQDGAPQTIVTETVMPDENTQAVMRPEFMESCATRPEYGSKRRKGTIDKHCKCIFDTTMKGLSEEASEIAGLYLYGETHDAFKARLKTGTVNIEAMGIASNAVGKAAKRCR